MTTSPTILIMAGGTGGHIMPGLAVADVLRDRGWTVRWLGHPEKMEGQIVPARGYELAPLRFAGLRGRGLRAKAVAPFLLMRALWQAWGHFSKIRPNVVLGMGGYVSFPGGVVSALRARPLVLHEQNAIAGMANKVLARISKRVLAGFPGALVGAEVVGNPVRHEVVALEDPLQRYSQRTGALRLLVVGGSLGATALNNMLLRRLPVCLSRGVQRSCISQARSIWMRSSSLTSKPVCAQSVWLLSTIWLMRWARRIS